MGPIRSQCQQHRAIASLALMLGSARGFLVMFELLLRDSLPDLPLRYHKYLPAEIFMLAQHSSGPGPNDYVAIFGDSHPQGGGD